MIERVGITWQLSDVSGWGVFGWNLVVELIKRGKPLPLLLVPPDIENPPANLQGILDTLGREQAELDNMRSINPGRIATLDGAAVLHHLGNDLSLSKVSESFRGSINAGFVFLESTDINPANLDKVAKLDRVLAGSSWNGEVLRSLGLENVEVLLQGIDPSLFHLPDEGADNASERFTIFSGGKLEYRKGQDIVLAAFRAFRERHADARLMTLWQNPWPQTSETLALSPHISSLPGTGPTGQLDLAAWAASQGLPEGSFDDLGFVPNARLPDVLHQADVAVFPNRCEGGTNLVAMECLACGIPTVLSANTGHLDLITDDTCYPLRDQTPVASDGGTDGWGESSVDELVEVLEDMYQNREQARRRGRAAAEWMLQLTWERQTGKILNALGWEAKT